MSDTYLHCGVTETVTALYGKCFGKNSGGCDLYGLANNLIAHKMELLKVGESIINVFVSKTLFKESTQTPQDFYGFMQDLGGDIGELVVSLFGV